MGCRRISLALAACVIASCLRCSVAYNLGGSIFPGAFAGSLRHRASLQQGGAKLAAVRGAARAGAAPAISMQGRNFAGVDFAGPLRGIPVTKSALVEADVESCYEIAADFGQYLNWARNNGMQEVKVLEEYPDGRGKRVKFRAKPPLGPDLDNELAYSWDAPNKIMFRSLSGNVMKTLDGSYTFTKQPRGTLIEYELAVQFPGFGVPDIIQKQISGIIAQTAVFELKEYIRKKTPRR